MSNSIPSNTPATLYVNVQLTVIVPVPASALANDAEITFATQNIQDIVAHAFKDYSTAFATCTPETIALGADVYDLNT